MRAVRLFAVALVLTQLFLAGHPRGQAGSNVIAGTDGVTFYGIGDLATGSAAVGSAVRDATRVNGTLYAVGATATGNQVTCTAPNTPSGCVTPPAYNLDTPVLWTATSGLDGALTPLPPGPSYPDQTQPGAPGNSISAYAITPGATFIASQAHTASNLTSGTTHSTRVTRADLPTNLANTDLFLAGGGDAGLAISNLGDVVYGQAIISGGLRRVGRWSTVGGNVAPPIPAGMNTATTWTLPIPRGTSSDGGVMVGVASPGAFGGSNVPPFGTNATAFRYVSATNTTSVIPPLVSGAWNFPIALSSDGNTVVVAGNDNTYFNGQVYLFNAQTSVTTPIGSPNTAWTPRLLGGMTSDGEVVAVTFANSSTFGPGGISGLGLPTSGRYAYFHNDNGWFQLGSALAARGIDLQGHLWDATNLAITGVRTVDGVDLVYGQGRRLTFAGNVYAAAELEGFVVEFPAGFLATFNAPPPAPPADPSIIGTWRVGGGTDAAPNNVVAYLADGTYVRIAPNGYESGRYAWAANGAFTVTTLIDTDGPGGFSSLNGTLGRTLTISGTGPGSTYQIFDSHCSNGCPTVTATKLGSEIGNVLGGWDLWDETTQAHQVVGVFAGTPGTNSGKYFVMQRFSANEENAEIGNWSWNAGAGTLSFSGSTEYRNGLAFPRADEPDPAALTADGLGLIIGTTPPELFSLRRIVDQASVVPIITNQDLTASGTDRGALTYPVTATYSLSFAAMGLPPGLSIDIATGVISGTATRSGTFSVEITATNTFGDFTTKTLVITIAPAPASFRGIGDLPGPGGTGSAVRDALRLKGTIYAVGASTVNSTAILPSVPELDTPALWTWPGSGGGVLEALPYLDGVSNTQTTSRSAYAITPDAAYLASQAQKVDGIGTGTQWVRVTRSDLPATTANVNLTQNLSNTPVFAALAISDGGTTLYGQQQINGGLPSETRPPARFDTVDGFNTPTLPAGKTWGYPIPRGTSSDGLVMVGPATTTHFAISTSGVAPNQVLGTNSVAFRYEHSAGSPAGTTTAIPMLSGGSWNFPIALSSSGAVTVVAGNGSAYPNGGIYLTNAANTITEVLGSPLPSWIPRLLGGLTDDGVVAVTFGNGIQNGPGQIGGLGIPIGALGGSQTLRAAYLHNGHGWFQFSSVLASEGVTLASLGWDPADIAITGMRTVEGVDLVFGQGRRTATNTLEGFVAEIPAGRLAAYYVPPPAITNTLIASGADRTAFTFSVTADNALSYAASGLPHGLSINATTGVISGSTNASGTFNVVLTVTNAFGVTDTKTLVLNVTPSPASFQGIGDLAGAAGTGIASLVRDATRFNGTLYAVGASTLTATGAVPNLDTAVVWDSSAVPSLTALPDVVVISPPQTTVGPVAAAITEDAQFIANRARLNAAGNANGVRVTRSTLTNKPVGGFAAAAISDNGNILYSQQSGGNVMVPSVNNTRAIRSDVSGAGSVITQAPLLGAYLDSVPAYRGMSSDGSVMVGTAFTGAFTGLQNQFSGTNGIAFRWVYPALTVTEIPRPTGSSWSIAIAVSPDGNRTLAAGNSAAYPNGEVWLHNALTGTSASYGSPNTAWVPRMFGGMTADGQVVAVTFTAPNVGSGQNPLQSAPNNKFGYIHNIHGWFHLSSVLAAQGIDLVANGWDSTNLAITGIRTVEGADLIYGQGRRRSLGATNYVDGAVEGFVAELPAGVLASFNPQPTPPSDQSIVGAWGFPANTTSPTIVFVYMADGTYYSIAANGAESGLFTWAGNGQAYSVLTRFDGNGSGAPSQRNGQLGLTLTVAGDQATITDTNCGVCTPTVLSRVTSVPGTLQGAWLAGTAAVADDASLVVFVGGNYFFAHDGPSTNEDGAQLGTFQWTDNQLTTTSGGQPEPPDPATLSRDELQLSLVDIELGNVTFTRIVSRSSVVPVITSAATATGELTQPFNFAVTANHGQTFAVAGSLPDGLSLDTETGIISGVPQTVGNFPVTVTATNTFTDTSAPSGLTITVTKATQTFGLVAQATAIYGDTFSVSTSGGSSGLTSYAASDGCTNVGNTITMVSGTISCTIVASNAGDDTYAPATAIATVAAAPRPASVTPAASGKVYGSADPILTGALSGFLAADGVTATYGRAVGENVAIYAISASLSPAAVLGNYSITSNTANFSITKAGSSTALASSLPSSTYGQSVTFTATVTSAAGVPNGTVTFNDGASPLATAPVNASGIATYTTATLASGSHPISATYSGGANYNGGTSGGVSQAVAVATTATSLASSPNPSSPGQTVNFVASIVGQYGGAVTGTVTFKKGPNVIGTAPVTAGGTATLPLSNLGTGPHVIAATYGGDASSLSSTSSAVTQNVVAPAAATTTTVTSSLNPSVAGQSVTLTASVTSGSPGIPGGTVTFRLGQTPLATVLLANGQASYPTSQLPAGTLGITAVYSGDAQFITSTSAGLSQIVSKASTTTTLVSGPNPSTFGQTVTFTATVVSSTGAIATGSVEFVEGSTTLGSGVLNAAGVATFTTPSLTLKNGKTATHNIKAKYLGDANDTNSTSATYAQTVQP